MERAPDVPLLLLCTARPELFARRPTWATGVSHATTISLSPLTDVEMSELLGTLLLRSVLSPESSGELVQRAGGNPLYAREFVHMLEDRGEGIAIGPPSAGQDGGPVTRAAAASLNVPDTVQALIAARLDALEAADRRLLQAASVVGDRFWRGALATLEPDASDLEASLRTLQRRGPDPSFVDERDRGRSGVLVRARPDPRRGLWPLAEVRAFPPPSRRHRHGSRPIEAAA